MAGVVQVMSLTGGHRLCSGGDGVEGVGKRTLEVIQPRIQAGQQREEAMWGENMVVGGGKTGGLNTMEEHLYLEDHVENLVRKGG